MGSDGKAYPGGRGEAEEKRQANDEEADPRSRAFHNHRNEGDCDSHRFSNSIRSNLFATLQTMHSGLTSLQHLGSQTSLGKLQRPYSGDL